MSESTKPGEVIQLRLVVHASDFEEAVEFYLAPRYKELVGLTVVDQTACPKTPERVVS